jgi:hypothetical protein
MGQSKEQKKLFAEITASLNALKQPSAAQSYLDTQALEAGKFLESGDYRNTPKNAFFSIEDPAVENQRRRVMMDSLGSGTTALASNSANSPNSTALSLNRQYLDDKWSRDSAANYQNQVADASQRITGAVQNSANSTLQRQNAILNGQMGALQVAPRRSSLWGDLLRGGLSIGGSLAEKFL